jgi:hypothetical protein
MLNSFQHLIRSRGYKTLNQVQGDTKRFGQQPLLLTHLCTQTIIFDSQVMRDIHEYIDFLLPATADNMLKCKKNKEGRTD